jgi:hypothetical protein
MDRQRAAAAATKLYNFFQHPIDAADPKTFLAGVVAVLERYDEATVESVIDPRGGLPSRHQFPPSIADVKSACDTEAMSRAKLKTEPAIPLSGSKRVALCHLWLRAKELGDPKADARLREFSATEIADAYEMTMAEAESLWPEAAARRSKSLDQYGPLMRQDDDEIRM